MKTITVDVYSFDELSKDVQKKVLEKFRYINTEDWNWWDYTYKDAENIGLKITDFKINRNAIIGELLLPMHEVCEKILAEHGKDCETYKIATEYLNNEADEDVLDLFKSKLLRAYYRLLDEEFWYLISDQNIKETIIANEYCFLKNGTHLSHIDFNL